MTKEEVFKSIPLRKYRGVYVERAPFREFVKLLNNYRFTEQELNILQQEILQLKEDLKIDDANSQRKP